MYKNKPTLGSEQEQYKSYWRYYTAAKKFYEAEMIYEAKVTQGRVTDSDILLIEKNRADGKVYWAKADSLHKEKRYPLIFVQWLIESFYEEKNEGASDDVQIINCLTALHGAGLNFNMTTRDNKSMLLDTIERSQTAATIFYCENVKQKIAPHSSNIIDATHPLFRAYAHETNLSDKKMFRALSAAIPELTDGHDTAMTLAAKYGNIAILEELLNYEQVAKTINEPDACTMTPLMYALLNGHHAYALTLINRGANFFCKTNLDKTPLHFLFEHSAVKNSKQLLNSPLLLSAIQQDKFNACVDRNGLHPIHAAIRTNQTKWFELFLSKNPSLVNITTTNGDSLFEYAIDLQNLDIAKYLHNNQQHPLHTKSDNPAPLFRALTQENSRVLAWLLTQENLDNQAFFATYGKRADNLAGALIAHNQLAALVDFKLFNKNIDQLLYKNEQGDTCLELFSQKFNTKKAWEPIDHRFFNHVIAELNAFTPSQAGFSTFNYFQSFYNILKRALKHEPNMINKKLLHNQPLLQSVEQYLYHQHLRDGDLDVAAYKKSMQSFITTYKIKNQTLNATDPHLFINILNNGHAVTKRIDALYALGGFSLINMDADNMSLLDHACKLANRELLDWCLQRPSKETLTTGSSRHYFFDCALMTKDFAFCQYLFNHKDSQQQWLAYFKTIDDNDDRMQQLQEYNFFNLSLNNNSKAFKDMLNWHNPLFSEYFLDKPTPSVVPEPEPVTVTAEDLENAITTNNVKKIQLFQTELYKNALETALIGNIEHFLKLCMNADNYKKIKKHQQKNSASGHELNLNMMQELMHIKPIHDWIVQNFHQALTISIKSHSVCALLLCLNKLPEQDREPILSRYGFDYAVQALNSKNPFLLHRLLEQPAILTQVIKQKNTLLLLAIQNSSAADALLLLHRTELSDFAHLGNNEALNLACKKPELSSVSIALLQLPLVFQNSNAANRNDAEQNQDDDLMYALSTQLVVERCPLFVPIITITSYDYEQAILYDNIQGLTQLLSFYQDPSLIKHLILYALHCSKPTLVAALFNQCRNQNEITQDSLFCYQMMYDAILSNCPPAMSIGFVADSCQPFLHLFDNQLLEMCINMGLLDIAHQFLNSPKVKENAHCFNNKLLRLACVHGHLPLVKDLLKIHLVREKANAYDYAAYRKALSRNHEAVVMCLLDVLHVFNFACQNKSRYCHSEWVMAYANTKLTFWAANQNHRLSKQEQQYRKHFINVMQRAGLCDAILSNQANISALLSQHSLFTPDITSDNSNPFVASLK